MVQVKYFARDIGHHQRQHFLWNRRSKKANREASCDSVDRSMARLIALNRSARNSEKDEANDWERLTSPFTVISRRDSSDVNEFNYKVDLENSSVCTQKRAKSGFKPWNRIGLRGKQIYCAQLPFFIVKCWLSGPLRLLYSGCIGIAIVPASLWWQFLK